MIYQTLCFDGAFYFQVLKNSDLGNFEESPRNTRWQNFFLESDDYSVCVTTKTNLIESNSFLFLWKSSENLVFLIFLWERNSETILKHEFFV